MILTVDVGNSNIVLGGVEGSEIHFEARLRTDATKTSDEYCIDLKMLLEVYGVAAKDIEGSIIASVVPQVLNSMQTAIKKLTGKTSLVVGPGLKTGLNIKIENPAQTGADLVVGSVAALREHKAPLIVIADGITDPYNLGALIRCAEGCGAHGLIIPKRRAVGLTPLVSKASAGAVEHLAIAKVANIGATVRALKKEGVWVFAAEAGGKPYYETNFKGPCALIFGSEGNGVSQIVISKCDAITSIPMYGKVNSFNVSTAASVILCEAARQNKN